MAYVPEIVETLPPSSEIGPVAEVFDTFYASSNEHIHTLRILEASLFLRTLQDIDIAQLSPEQLTRLRESHEAFIRNYHDTVNTVLKQPLSREEKSKMLASQFIHVISGFSFDPAVPSTGFDLQPPDNHDYETQERHQDNFERHAEISDEILELLERRYSVLGLPPLRLSRIALTHRLTSDINDELIDILENVWGVKLEHEVKLFDAEPLLKMRNIGMVIGAAGIFGLIVSSKAAKLPLRALTQLVGH